MGVSIVLMSLKIIQVYQSQEIHFYSRSFVSIVALCILISSFFAISFVKTEKPGKLNLFSTTSDDQVQYSSRQFINSAGVGNLQETQIEIQNDEKEEKQEQLRGRQLASCSTISSFGSLPTVKVSETSTFSFTGFQTSKTNIVNGIVTSTCLNSFTYSIDPDVSYLLIDGNSIKIAPISSVDIGTHSLTLKAVSTVDPAFTLSYTFQVQISSGKYPTFTEAIPIFNVIKGISVSYTVPQLTSSISYSSSLTSQSLPSFVTFDSSSRTFSIYPPLGYTGTYFTASLNFNLKSKSSSSDFFGVSVFSTDSFNQVFTIKIYLTDPTTFPATIDASASTQTSDKLVKISFTGANTLTLKNPQTSFNNKDFFTITGQGNRQPYVLSLTFMSMTYLELNFKVTFSNYNNTLTGEFLIFKFTSDYVLMNSVTKSKMKSNLQVSIPLLPYEPPAPVVVVPPAPVVVVPTDPAILCPNINFVSNNFDAQVGIESKISFNNFQKFQDKTCIKSFTYAMKESYAIIFLQGQTVVISSNTQTDAGNYIVTIIGTSSTDTNVVLQTSFTITIKTSGYPSFKTGLSALTVFRGQAITYNLPELTNVGGYTYGYTVVTALPNFIQYDYGSRNLQINAGPSVTVPQFFNLQFSMNVKAKVVKGADTFFGATVISINGFSNKFYVRVSIFDNLPVISLSVLSVSPLNRVSIGVTNANRLINSTQQLYEAVRSQTIFNSSIVGNSSDYKYQINFVSMIYTTFIFDIFLLNQPVVVRPIKDDGDIAWINFTDYTILDNLDKHYKMAPNQNLKIPLKAKIEIVPNITNDTSEALNAALDTVQNLGSKPTTTSQALVSLTGLLNILSGASMAFLWSLINAVQMYEFMPLAQVNTPDFVYAMVSKVTIAKFDFIPKEEIMTMLWNTSQAQNVYMPNFAASTQNVTNFFYLTGDLFIVLFLLLIVFLIFAMLHLCCRKRTQFFMRAMKGYRFGVFIRVIIEEYLPTLIASLITIFNWDTTNSFEVASLIAAFMFFFIYIGLFIGITVLFLARFNEIQHEKAYYKDRFFDLYSELKKNRRIYLMYHPLFMLNRTIVAISLIVLTSNFYVQIWLIILSQFCFMMYLILFRPFLERSKNILEIFNEACIFVSAIILFSFSQMNPDSSSLITYGWLFLSVLFFNLVVNLVKGLSEGIAGFYLSFKRKCLYRCRKKKGIVELRDQIQATFAARMKKVSNDKDMKVIDFESHQDVHINFEEPKQRIIGNISKYYASKFKDLSPGEENYSADRYGSTQKIVDEYARTTFEQTSRKNDNSNSPIKEASIYDIDQSPYESNANLNQNEPRKLSHNFTLKKLAEMKASPYIEKPRILTPSLQTPVKSFAKVAPEQTNNFMSPPDEIQGRYQSQFPTVLPIIKPTPRKQTK